MRLIVITGRLGEDARYKQTQKGDEYCSFRVAADDGFGERKTTLWFDVTKWGKGTSGLSEILLKGTPVTVTGSLGTREYEGKTYLQINAQSVDVQGSRPSQQQGGGGNGVRRQKGDQGYIGAVDDLDDDSIPFIRGDGMF